MATENPRLKASVEILLKGSTNVEAARNGLGALFPKLRSILGTIRPGDADENSFLKHRIAHAAFAATYFGLDPKRAVWGRSELQTILQSPTPGVSLEAAIVTLQSSSFGEDDRVSLRAQLLDALEESFTNEDQKLSPAWFRAVVDASPVFLRAQDTKSRGFYRVSNEERLRWLLVRPMRNMSPNDRSELIRPNIADVADISLLCDVFRSMAGDVTVDGATPSYGENAFGEQTQQLREQLVLRVRKLAGAGEFWTQALPVNILWFWRGSGHEDEVREFTQTSMNDPSLVASVLLAPINEVIASAGNYFQVRDEWNKVVDLDALAKIAGMIVARSDIENDRIAASRFLEARQNAIERPF